MRFVMPFVKIDVDLSEAKALIQQLKKNRNMGLAKIGQTIKEQASEILNQLMQTEFRIFLGKPEQKGNKRNGYKERTYAVKGVGTIKVRIPRDRKGEFESTVIPKHERMDPRVREDIAVLQLAGISVVSDFLCLSHFNA